MVLHSLWDMYSIHPPKKQTNDGVSVHYSFRVWYNMPQNVKKDLSLTRIQRILRRHVDVSIVDVAQHGLKCLLTGNHLANGDIYLAVLWHEGAEHGLKITEGTWSKGDESVEKDNNKKDSPSSRSVPGTSRQYGFMSRSGVSVQQQNDVTELQAPSLQVSLRVLHQGGPDVHRLV